MSFRMRTRPVIEFLCAPEDEGVIAPPVPARDYLPDWFRRLPATDPEVMSRSNTGLTVKRCLPFLEAMTVGWIIPLAAEVLLEIRNGGTEAEAGWTFDRTLVSAHGAHQVRGHPHAGRPPRKFHNFWTIRTPPGWSCLFTDPLNRPNGLFEVVSGVVDTDIYAAPVHFPFFATGPDGLHVIAKGSPLVQVIPFRRSSTDLGAVIRSEAAGEADKRRKVHRNTLAAQGWYRKLVRAARKD